MMKMPPLFQPKVLQNALARFDVAQIPDVAQKREILAQWKHTIDSGKLKQAGEVALHGEFLGDLFGSVLGYTRLTGGQEEWNLALEQKTLLDATKADGALGFFTQGKTDIRAIIELKSATADLDAKQSKGYQKQTPVEQAFGYAPKHGKRCQWVLVSNYVELRLYHASSQVEYERFVLTDLTNEQEFARFYFLLARDQLLAKEGISLVESLYRKSEEAGARISKQFYADYTAARLHLFEHLKQHARSHRFSDGPESDKSLTTNQALTTNEELFLLEKTQKLLDRFIFICFCEDTGMLPANTFRKLLKQAQESFVFADAEHKIWPALKGLFKALDTGWKDQQIPKFNGELFKPDPGLDALIIGDEIFSELAAIAEYDFESDLNVNILGHIFEQSISDLEDVRANIRGEQVDRKQGKRKKEGIFYTPEYITRYIVEQAVGGWLEDRKHELGFERLPELTAADLDSVKLVKSRYKGSKKVEQHRAFWEAYREKLANITVLDPACGSGAFLNQAFRFLYEEGERVNAALAELSQGQRSTFDLHKHILSHNLYGVDINKESVEITKLSLWLLTARKGSELTALDDNITCGNSLIDDPLIAGDKAFKWEKKFPEIMQNGGFDVVIGNPPYVQSRAMSASHKEYFYKNYHTAEYQLNTFGLFVEKSINLLHNNAFYSLIIPNYWLSTQYDEKLRKLVFLRHNMIEVLNVFNVFESASVDTVLILGKKVRKDSFPKHTWIRSISREFKTIPERLDAISTGDWSFEKNIEFTGTESDPKVSFEEKLVLNGRYQLSDFVELKQGMKPYEKGKGNPPQTREMMQEQIYHAASKLDQTYLPLLRARSVRRYLLVWENDWIKYGDNLAAPRSKNIFEGDRILIRRIISGENIEGTFLSETYINNTDLINILPRQKLLALPLKALAAIILSRLCAHVLKQENVNLNRETFPKINVGTLKSFPIPKISPEQQSLLIQHVNTMLELDTQFHERTQKFLHFIESRYHPKKLSNKLQAFHILAFSEFVTELKKQKAKLSKQEEFDLLELFEAQKSQAIALQQQIDQTDQDIDTMVYELYGLTEEEIRILEKN
ncbi:MAG: N-6 DNA methylase [Candidatus Vecturithrix sp.]|nr:N-6 DNA methylase [Candidatus Vecturithrix sp.]